MEELVKKAKKGDPDAFTSLMQAQMQSMYKTARSIVQNDEDAADAISDTILVCWEKMGQLKNAEYFRTWMTRILINKCKDILRKKVNLFVTDQMPDIPSDEAGYGNVEWRQALHSLKEKYRLVMVLYYVEGFNTSEIGKVLDLPESTVRSRMARARAQLAGEYYLDGRKSL